jgi:hypothetical protein
MYANGQQIILYLGLDRRLYINRSPGKTLCMFEGRIFLKAAQGKDVLTITKIPPTYDRQPITAPPGCIIQGLE